MSILAGYQTDMRGYAFGLISDYLIEGGADVNSQGAARAAQAARNRQPKHQYTKYLLSL